MKTKNAASLWIEALKATLEAKHQPSRNGGTREVLGWSRTIENPRDRWIDNKRRRLSKEYGFAELLWYLLRTDDVKYITPYAPQYADLAAETNGRAFGAYGYRIANNIRACDMLTLAMSKLKSFPDTRQCVISLWKPDDLIHMTIRKDLPCTLTWQFMLRDNALHLSVSMRSNDVWLGTPYDVFVNTCILELAANTLGVHVGTYIHNVTSLHLYDKNLQAAQEALDSPTYYESDPPPYDTRDTLDAGIEAAETWRRMQQGSWCPKCIDKFGPLLGDALKITAAKFGY